MASINTTSKQLNQNGVVNGDPGPRTLDIQSEVSIVTTLDHDGKYKQNLFLAFVKPHNKPVTTSNDPQLLDR